MTISPFRSAPLRLSIALTLFAAVACSAGGDGEGKPGDGSEGVEPPGQAGSNSEAPPEDGLGGAGGSGDSGEPVGGRDASGGRPDSSGGRGGSEDRGGSDSRGGSEGDGTAGGGGDEEPEPEPPSEAFLRGQALVAQNGCVTCHQANFAGFTVFPNITPDEKTGIGGWTDEQIVAAIRDGVDVDGSNMCATMQRYSVSDADAADIVAFLRGIPAVSNKITSTCPGHGE